MDSPGLRRCAPEPWRYFTRKPLAAPFAGDDTGCARGDKRRQLSAAGDALQRLPASDTRPCTSVEPIKLAASTTPGQARCRASHSPITALGIEAPMTNPPSRSRMPEMPGIFLISTIRPGLARPERS